MFLRESNGILIPCFFDFYFIEINISAVVEYHAKVPPFF